MDCTLCAARLNAFELETDIGKEGICAECATTAMIMGGMDEHLAQLYYESGHKDVLDGGHRIDGQELSGSRH